MVGYFPLKVGKQKFTLCVIITLMNSQTILSYITSIPTLQTYWDTPSLQAAEIGDGNLNFVYRISDAVGKSLILKYAPPYLRLLGEDFKLPQHRICVEMHTMSYFQEITPSFIPTLYHCDETHFCFIMEDLQGYALLQNMALFGDRSVFIYERLGQFISALLHHSPSLKQEGYYENATLKAISRDYIFRFPHTPNHEALVVPSFFKPSSKSEQFTQNIAWLTKLFEEDTSCLLHGDLHTGSIMVKGEYVKIIDAEFSFFGPIGFDIGVLLAHMLFNEIYTAITYNTICYPNHIQALFKGIGALSQENLAHSVGFCGAELFRRLVVPAKSKALEALEKTSDKAKAYATAEAIAIDLVENCLHVKHYEDIITLVEKHL